MPEKTQFIQNHKLEIHRVNTFLLKELKGSREISWQAQGPEFKPYHHYTKKEGTEKTMNNLSKTETTRMEHFVELC
jgi:hypothetical protein